MKLTVVLMIITLLRVSAGVKAQNITLSKSKATLEQIFEDINKQTGYEFLYDSKIMKRSNPVDINISNAYLTKVLDICFAGQPLSYTIEKNMIVVKEKKQPAMVKDSLFKVSGRVFDTKEPPVSMPGVSIGIKHKAGGTTTDPNGNFEIKVAKGDTLTFKFVSFTTQEYVIKNFRDNIVIALKEEVGALDEVRITGYSEQKLKHLANSTSAVNIRASIEGKPITQLSQALQGGATGITVTQSSGLPGGDAATIKIRGISTLGDTNPLVLVDGVPYNIDDVDPTTVESISILKDAAAASIYGSRAANGVIVITTKRGIPGKIVVSYDSYLGLQTPEYLPNFVDAPKYMEMVNEAIINTGGTARYTADAIAKTRAGTDPLLYPNTDWKSLTIKNRAQNQSHTFGLTGGNNLARFAVTGSYLDQTGIIGSADAKRYALRANTSITLNNSVSMYLDLNVLKKQQTQNINYFSQDFGGPAGGVASGGTAYILQLIYNMPPNIVAKYPVRADGYQAYGNFAEMKNPVANLEKGGDRKVWSDDVNVNIQPVWSITPDLKLKGQYLMRLETDATRFNRDAYTFLDYYTNVVQFTYADNKGTTQNRNLYNYGSVILDFNKSFGKHTVYAVGGTVREQDQPDNFLQRNMVSYFVKLNYIFNDKYLFESTWRTDGSSLFAAGHKWGSFPSVAAGWNVDKESFLVNSKVINKLKLRGSYGLLGNNRNVQPYSYQNTISPANGAEVTIGNPDITWERVSMLDLGLDASFIDNKFGITVDWFNKKTDNILLVPPLSLSSGITRAIVVNSGSLSNIGWEFAVNYADQLSKDVSFSVNTGYSYYKNKILSLKNGPYISPESINKVGNPIGSYYGYKTNGLLQQSDITGGTPRIGSGTSAGPSQVAGDIKYVDVNGDGTINDNDKVVLGSPEPQGNYFVNTRVAYRNFDLETQINGFTSSKGLYSGRYRVALDVAAGTPLTYQTDYWTPTNTTAKLPRLTTSPGNNVLMSDYWISNAAFARVRFIQLGYNFNKNLISKVKLSNARIYFNAQNPFTFTQFKYLDPESRGSEVIYPLMKTYTIGLSVKF